MANHGYMTISGKTQGLISAGCSTQDSIGNKCQSGHTDEIMVLSYSHNMANIGNINKPTHSPLIITKNVDKSSPLLAQALSSSEEISCTISFYRISAYGLQEKFFTIEIEGGIIADLTLDMPMLFCKTMSNHKNMLQFVIARSHGDTTSQEPAGTDPGGITNGTTKGSLRTR